MTVHVSNPDDDVVVAIVEDDRSVREMLTAVFTHEGYTVLSFESGENASKDRSVVDADVVVLDVGLPGIDGMSLCARLRRDGRTGPILMLTARHEISDRVAGLDSGADDYLVKPFALDELLARVRAMARRSVPIGTTGPGAPVLDIADLEIDLATRQAHRNGKRLDLTKLEFDLLHLLVANSPMVLTRDVIYERIWGYDGTGSNSLDVFVSQLRKKLEGDDQPRLIHTIRGVGYAARPPE